VIVLGSSGRGEVLRRGRHLARRASARG
jgi:hypothetical protein